MGATPENEKKSLLTDSAWMTVFVAALTTLSAIALSEVQSVTQIGWPGVVCALILVLGLYWIVIWQVGRPLERILTDLKSDLIIQQFQAQHGWLLDVKQLAAYERNVKAREIWLITSDFSDDLQDGPFMKIIDHNLQKGIRYVYFFPNTPENKARAEMIHAALKSPLLKCIHLPDNFFFLVPKLDIVIYNPRGEGGLPKSAFMGIPVPGESGHYHAGVSLDFIDKIVGTLLDSYQKQIGNL